MLLEYDDPSFIAKLEIGLAAEKRRGQNDSHDSAEEDERHLFRERQYVFGKIHRTKNDNDSDAQGSGRSSKCQVRQAVRHQRPAFSVSGGMHGFASASGASASRCRGKIGVGPLPNGLKPVLRQRSKIVSS